MRGAEPTKSHFFPFSSVGLWYVVQRTKLCLDFTCTVHLLHLFCCLAWNSSLPYTLTWWCINLGNTPPMFGRIVNLALNI